MQHFKHVSVAVVDNHRIDAVNVLEATFEGMVEAVEKLQV